MEPGKRKIVIAVAVILVAASLVIVAAFSADGRTRSERLILTSVDLTEIGATQVWEPISTSSHPDFRSSGGSEAANSKIGLSHGNWLLGVECLLIIYNSSSLASEHFHAKWSDTNWTGDDIGEALFVAGVINMTNDSISFNRTFTAIVLEGYTITYFVFEQIPHGGPRTIPLSTVESILGTQVNKVRLAE
jgi:hypothetical protein